MTERQPKVEVASYKGKRIHPIIKIFLALALTGILCFGALLGLVLAGSHNNIAGDPQVMVILGCKLEDWGPSWMLKDRLDKALEYLEDHPDMTVVVSGGQGSNEPDTEAQGMADYLADHGFARENILLEPESHNTWQNLNYTAQRLEENGYDIRDGILIVSNGFHLTRARMLADRIGYNNISVLAAPSSHTPSRLKMYIREPIALVKSFVLDR